MKQSTIAKIVLFMTAVLWGSTFTIGKLASEAFSASFIIALRFLIASTALLVVAYPQRKQLDKKYWVDGFWMGITLFASYMLQVGGLALVTLRMFIGFVVIFVAILLSQWEGKKQCL